MTGPFMLISMEKLSEVKLSRPNAEEFESVGAMFFSPVIMNMALEVVIAMPFVELIVSLLEERAQLITALLPEEQPTDAGTVI